MASALNVSPVTARAISKTKKASFLSEAMELSGRDLLDVIDAASRYIKLKNRTTHPEGTFDSAKRFYLNKRCECCAGIRSPSRNFPFSHITHGRSVVHVAHEAGLQDHISLIRRISNYIEKHSIGEVYALFNDSQKFHGAILERDLGL